MQKFLKNEGFVFSIEDCYFINNNFYKNSFDETNRDALLMLKQHKNLKDKGEAYFIFMMLLLNNAKIIKERQHLLLDCGAKPEFEMIADFLCDHDILQQTKRLTYKTDDFWS